MAQLFKSAILLLMTERCLEEYLYKSNFLDVDCFKSSLSKSLGLGIIIGSVLVKLPQILKIISNKSGEGLNIYGTFLELTAMTVNISYSYINGFPFSAWGDVLMLTIQTAIIALLIYHYNNQNKEAALFLVSYLAVCFVLMGGLTPLNVLWILQGCTIPILLIGKLLQAWSNYKNGSTGQLSAATVFALTGGSLARIFTSIQETGDLLMVTTYLAATSANIILAMQMLYYWNVKSKKPTTKKTKSNKKQN